MIVGRFGASSIQGYPVFLDSCPVFFYIWHMEGALQAKTRTQTFIVDSYTLYFPMAKSLQLIVEISTTLETMLNSHK